MKNLPYYACLLIVAARILKFTMVPGSGILLALGLLMVAVCCLWECIRYRKNGHDRRNLLLLLLIATMSVILYGKYQYWTFADIPGLVIIPGFIIAAILYFAKGKHRKVTLTVTTVCYLLLTVPLFAGIRYFKAPTSYIPQRWWYLGYSHTTTVAIKVLAHFEKDETKQLFAYARDFINKENYQEAIQIFQQARKIEPHNPWLFIGLSVCFQRLNQPKTALALMDSAININNQIAAFYVNRGTLYYAVDENSKSKADCLRGIKIDSTFYPLYTNLAMSYYYEEMYDSACICIVKAEKLGADIREIPELQTLKRRKCGILQPDYEYYASGSIKKERIYSGKDTSAYLQKDYFPNGKLRQMGNYVNGRREGEWKGWYADGDMDWKAQFVNGIPQPIPENPRVEVVTIDPVWYAGVPQYLRVYIEGACPQNTGIVCSNCTIAQPSDTTDYDFNTVVIPKRSGKMFFRVSYLENDGTRIWLDQGQDTIIVKPKPDGLFFE
ncbi:MAG: tetratricopeptide repeat protein [Bacteroidales bacterium]|nr:tetratricopeptide repeat protein [Bacteroidales bacterium]